MPIGSSVKKIIIGLLLVAAVGAVIVYDQHTRRPYPSPGTLKLPPEPIEKVKLEEFRYWVDRSIPSEPRLYSAFTIVNDNPYSLGWVKIHCDFTGDGGTKIYEMTLQSMGTAPANSRVKHDNEFLAWNARDLRAVECKPILAGRSGMPPY
jgi:hypothetical protein